MDIQNQFTQAREKESKCAGDLNVAREKLERHKTYFGFNTAPPPIFHQINENMLSSYCSIMAEIASAEEEKNKVLAGMTGLITAYNTYLEMLIKFYRENKNE